MSIYLHNFVHKIVLDEDIKFYVTTILGLDVETKKSLPDETFSHAVKKSLSHPIGVPELLRPREG